MTTPFSKRHGVVQVEAPEITIIKGAPHELRGFLPNLRHDCGLTLDLLRERVCVVCQTRKNPNNYGPKNIEQEIQSTLDSCEWYLVYDLIEDIVSIMEQAQYPYDLEKFTTRLNDYFVAKGIGWKLTGTTIERRGSEPFETEIKTAEEKLNTAGLSKSHQELTEARKDLSRRPMPDVTGAIQHACVALECVARKVTGGNATLGDLIKRHADLLPKPLDACVEKLWGFASEYARHGSEDKTQATIHDAELVVGIAAIMTNFLLNKNSEKQAKTPRMVTP